jgi:hypothetical protein
MDPLQRYSLCTPNGTKVLPRLGVTNLVVSLPSRNVNRQVRGSVIRICREMPNEVIFEMPHVSIALRKAVIFPEAKLSPQIRFPEDRV